MHKKIIMLALCGASLVQAAYNATIASVSSYESLHWMILNKNRCAPEMQTTLEAMLRELDPHCPDPVNCLSRLGSLFIIGDGMSAAVTDVTPIGYLTNLTLLNLVDNNVYDVTPFVKLTKLKKLYLTGNSIEDITPLAALPDLEELWLGDNPIKDLKPLTKLPKLKTLALDVRQIRALHADALFPRDIIYVDFDERGAK